MYVKFLHCSLKQKKYGTEEVQLLKAMAALTEDMGSISRTHILACNDL